MFWEILWALMLGFALSGAVFLGLAAALVSRVLRTGGLPMLRMDEQASA